MSGNVKENADKAKKRKKFHYGTLIKSQLSDESYVREYEQERGDKKGEH